MRIAVKVIPFSIGLMCLVLVYQNCSNSGLELPTLSENDLAEIEAENAPPPPPLVPRMNSTIDTANVSFGESFEISVENFEDNPSNIFVWMRNGEELLGENNPVLLVDGLNYIKQGIYSAVLNGSVVGEVEVSVKPARSCKQIIDFTAGAVSGDYEIDPDGEATDYQAYSVECDMTTAGGGWTKVTISQARQLFGGQLVAVQAGSSSGFDASHRPFSESVGAVGDPRSHTYHYTFEVPFGYREFRTINLQSRARSQAGQEVDVNGGAFVQMNWTIANADPVGSPQVGDIGFGSPLNAGPTVSLAQAFANLTLFADNQLVTFPFNNVVHQVSATSVNSFRIGWGAAGAEREGWFPWFSGDIEFR